ncbi:MAG: hypothetical protein HY807_09235 [Nitrospirae bacterium]|nr:hypothetical protein [Nitrospirota bacterium]
MIAISRALTEVWEWKDAVNNDTTDMSVEERIKYFGDGLVLAEQLLHGRLIRNEDGSYTLK